MGQQIRKLLLCTLLLAGSGIVVPQVHAAGQAASRQDTSDVVPQIIKAVSPSVVGIIGKYTGDTAGPDSRYNLTHGSGIVVKADGWIISNAHVMKDLQDAVAVTSDGKTYDIVKTVLDEVSDLALLKVNAKGLKPVKFAAPAAKTQVGDKVIAIGTPVSFSLRNSATVGVISGLNRSVDAAYRLIQSDTAINPGNSGGPLVNLKGEVLGINTLKYAAVDVENMGFAIPADTVQYIVSQLLKSGEVIRPSLGLELEESWPAIVGLPTEAPLTVTGLISDEAREAGIGEGDALYAIDGHRVFSQVDINELFKAYTPGKTVKLLMQSGGDIVARKLVLSQGDPLLNVTGAEGDSDGNTEE
ncbi:S1C family serine protease [Paenibacillus tepidiphilus]|uniref:S1C family serine protease n=1 Tax=Paenibacillus tepidiphilus TaxID=2608683 RepID=UPI001EF0A869|nr:trypsin-like peptidase domain-containing protein [Paenibacillus tepidiphilus]